MLHVQAVVSEAMSDDHKFYNLQEVEDLARKVLPKAVSTKILPGGLYQAFFTLQTIPMVSRVYVVAGA